jgi:hypothetical protein
MKKHIISLILAMAVVLTPVAIVLGRQYQGGAAKPPQSTTSQTAPKSTQPKPAHTMHTVSGRVRSVSDNQVVITHGTFNKQETFSLNADTKREGTLSAGEMVKVEYFTQGKENIATMVQVQPLKAATRSKKARKS